MFKSRTFCFSVCELIWTFLSWSRRPCFLGGFHLLQLSHLCAFSSVGFPEFWEESFHGDNTLGMNATKDLSLWFGNVADTILKMQFKFWLFYLSISHFNSHFCIFYLDFSDILSDFSLIIEVELFPLIIFSYDGYNQKKSCSDLCLYS